MMLCMHWVLASMVFFGCGAEKSSDDAVLEETVVEQDTAIQQDTGNEAPPSDCDIPAGLNWSNWGRSFFRTWCSGCHGAAAPDRYGAPEWLVFDTEAQVFGHRAMIRSSVLDAESMPLGGGLPGEESELLDLYLRCVLGD